MWNDDTVKVLNELVQTSEDGKKGFADAAESATASELKLVFHRRSLDCATAATELQDLVKTLGGTPKDCGTMTGAAHRGWAKVKATVGDANLGMLKEIERAEDQAKAAYTKALTVRLPPEVHLAVQRQHQSAVRNHDLIRDLRSSYRAAKHAAPH